MSRSPLPLVIEDVSAFATALRKQWPLTEPTHSQMLNLIAKAAGYRNHQHVKSEVDATVGDLDKSATQRIKDALRVFDDVGLMTRWPKKTSVQALCLAWFWSQLPAKRDLTEQEVNAALMQSEAFGDHVLLRRSLIDHGMAKRTPNGKTYRRIERQPSQEERHIIRQLSERVLVARVNDDNKGTRPAFGAPI